MNSNTLLSRVTALWLMAIHACSVSAAPFAYLVDSGGDHVTVIDTATQVVSAYLLVNAHPSAIAISADGTSVFVANAAAQKISRIDGTTNQVVATIPVGNIGLDALAFDSARNRLYGIGPTQAQVSSLIVIDTLTNSVIGTPVPLGNLSQCAVLTPDGSTLYVTDSSSSNVAIVDTATLLVTKISTAGQRPFCLAMSPDGRHAYVAYGDGTVSTIDTELKQFVGTSIPFPSANLRGIVVSPDNSKLYVIGGSELFIADLQLQSVTGVVEGLGTLPLGLALVPGTNLAYVTLQQEGTVQVVDLVQQAIVDSFVYSTSLNLVMGNFIGPATLSDDIFRDGFEGP